ncbi:MAG: DUF6106 family protein [Lachnospiraceae bacterium]|nr:DUF6106 family protein [Lachnospiraceae bacterium]
MGDSYVESLVERERNSFYALLKNVSYAVCGICVLVAILTGIPLLFLVAVAVGIIGVFVVPNPDYEFEYLFIGKELSIDKIIAKSNRKTLGSYDLDKMEFMCPLTSHELDSYKSKNTPVRDYSSRKEGVVPYVLVYKDGNQEILVYLEPDPALISAIKTVMPRKVMEY